jgi:hypothetical protein
LSQIESSRLPTQFSALSNIVVVAAVGLGMKYKVNVVSPEIFINKELWNAQTLYGHRQKLKVPQPVNYLHLKMQSSKIHRGFNSSELSKLAITTITNDQQPFKINVSFEKVKEGVASAFLSPQNPLYAISATFSSADSENKDGFRNPFKSLTEFDIVFKAPGGYFLTFIF